VEEETYTVQEAARILRTTERTVRRHLERIPPQIEAPQETSESAETVDEQQGRGQPHSDAPGAPDAVQRPWWRRVFGRGR
jgi:predicted ArsR family transcriptional regulator